MSVRLGHMTRERFIEKCPHLKEHLDGMIARGWVGVQPNGELFVAKGGGP